MNRTSRTLLAVLAIAASAMMAKDLKYSVVPNYFENNPGGAQLGPCHGGVVIDKKGNFYVTTLTERGIVVYSKEGKYVRSFGPSKIHGLEIRDEKGTEYLYAARNEHHEVVKIGLDGKLVWTLTYPKESGLYKDANGFNPCAVTVGPDDSIYVADGYGSNYVLKFDKDRHFIKAFGGPGEVEGKFKTCHGIALDKRFKKPLLLVCNRNNNRVEHWDLDGNFVKVIQKDLRMPAAVHIRGEYAIFPELQGRVTVLNKEGEIVAQLGDNPDASQRANYGLPPDKWKDGICNSPHGASMDQKGNIVVSEWSAFGHMHMFHKEK